MRIISKIHDFDFLGRLFRDDDDGGDGGYEMRGMLKHHGDCSTIPAAHDSLQNQNQKFLRRTQPNLSFHYGTRGSGYRLHGFIELSM